MLALNNEHRQLPKFVFPITSIVTIKMMEVEVSTDLNIFEHHTSDFLLLQLF